MVEQILSTPIRDEIRYGAITCLRVVETGYIIIDLRITHSDMARDNMFSSSYIIPSEEASINTVVYDGILIVLGRLCSEYRRWLEARRAAQMEELRREAAVQATGPNSDYNPFYYTVSTSSEGVRWLARY